jgi:integrase/recombinase XerC/integrase/recombinase XerD
MDNLISSWIYYFLKELQDVGCKSSHTLKSYKTDLEQVFYTEEKILNYEIISEEELLQKVLAAQTGWIKLSIASRNRKAGTLKSFFGWLYKKGFIESPLAEKISAPKVPRKIPNFISVDEAIYLVKTLRKQMLNSNNPQVLLQQALVLLLYGGGLRVSEACELIWANVNLEQKQILVKGKGGKERWIVLPQITIEALKYLSKGTQYIWGDKPLSPRVAYDWVRKIGVRAEILRPLNPHALRHSYATHLLQGGADLRILQELLGHSSLAATEKYTHLTVDHLARVVNALHPLKREFGDKL